MNGNGFLVGRSLGIHSAIFRGFNLIAVIAILFFSTNKTFAYVGKWHTYTNYAPTNAIINFQGKVFIGTMGGIRVIDPNTLSEKDYNSTDGLSDIQIIALAISNDNQLWAASHSGKLFRWENGFWSTWGSSYKVSGWIINPRGMISEGNYLIIASEKGISFFNRSKGVAQANLTKFGKSTLTQVTGLVRLGDTLFISNGTEVLHAAIDFDNVLSAKFGTIYDPQIWTKASEIKSPKGFGFSDQIPQTDTTVKEKTKDDVNLNLPIHLTLINGQVVSHDTGMILVTPYKVKAMIGRAFEIDGKSYPIFQKIEAAMVMGDKLFFGSKDGLYYYSTSNGGFNNIFPPLEFPRDTVANIAASKNGVYAMSGGSKVSLGSVLQFQNGNWKSVYNFNPSIELLQNELHTLSVTSEGAPVFGNWGAGLFDLSGGGNKNYRAGEETCIIPTEKPTYTSVQTLSDVSGDDVWMSVQRLPQTTPPTNWLVHVNLKSGKVSCPELAGFGYHTFSTRILNDKLLALAGGYGIYLFRWDKNGDPAALTLESRVGTATGDETGRDFGLDKFGRLWVLINDKIGFVDSLFFKLDKAQPLPITYLDNQQGRACKVMETDARKGFWIGCDNGLINLQPTSQSDAPIMEKFSTEDGLASDRIFDLSIVQETGAIWITTENGISEFESAAALPALGIDGVKAYPNPFLKKHQRLVIDGIPQGGTAFISTQTGNVIRQFHANELKGNQFQWDGTNAQGNAVKPGVYLYSVDADGKSTQGKIIVAR